MIKLDLSHSLISKSDKKSLEFINKKYSGKMHNVNAMIELKTGLGNDFLGWTSWPVENKKPLLDEIKTTATEMTLSKQLDTLVVIGIGGSYLGAKSMIDAINGMFPGKKQPVDIIFAGHTMSSTYTKQLLEELNGRNYAVNVISKSGTTLEPSLAFRLIRKHMEKKYGAEEAASRIIATTDGEKGVLKNISKKRGYKTFVIPDDIGGRFSVTTPVGLVPLAFAGIDIYQFMEGAKLAAQETKSGNVDTNSAMAYACLRHYMFSQQKKTTEIFGTYEIQLQMLGEWWKQLFGESEGKEGTGLFPASVVFSTDLHSLGQFIQEGNKTFFETILKIKEPSKNIEIENTDYADGLEFVEGMTMQDINYKAMQGTLNAHANNGAVPNIVIELEKMDAKGMGYFVQWMFKACAVSAYLLKVNPFNQPGVEVYKSKMFKLLGKTENNKANKQLDKTQK